MPFSCDKYSPLEMLSSSYRALLVNVTLLGQKKKDFWSVIKLRILRWKNHPGLSRWISVITRIPIRGRQEFQNQKTKRWQSRDQRERERERTLAGAFLLILKMKDSSMNQIIQVPSKSWKREQIIPTHPKIMQPCQHLDFWTLNIQNVRKHICVA